MIDYAIQQVVNALSAGSLYALMAVGLAMVFGILRLINFAHGDLMMISAYLAVFSLGAGLSLAAALPVIVIGTIAELKRQGRTILLVEQNVHQALDVADRAYVVETGRITLDGDAAVLRRDPKVEQSYLGVGGVAL